MSASKLRLAVLGGSGSLGQAVTAAAVAAGHTVTAVSRRPPAKLPDGVRHVVADVTTGIGLDAAFAGAEAIIDGTNARANAREVLVEGTKRVLDAAKAAGVPHFVGISIVGIDAAPLAYYKIKVEQEAVIQASPVPWSLLTYNTQLGGYEVNISDQQLQGAPNYANDNDWDWEDRKRAQQVFDYYRVPPYWI